MKEITFFILIITANIPPIQMARNENYIYYKEIERYCLPYYNCPPGSEIQPCFTDNNRDICSPCPDGLVQPDLISSSLMGDSRSTLCFQPTSHCYAYDITDSRLPTKSFCNSLSGCKCNTIQCYYGDPCLCNSKDGGCPKETTLNNKGECVPCPKGTAKNDTGCGPCRTVEVREHKLAPSLYKPFDNEVQRNVSRRMNRLVAANHSFQRYIKQKTEISTMSLSTLYFSTTAYSKEATDLFLISSIAVLAFLTFVLIITILCVCARRYGLRLYGFCWRNDPQLGNNVMNEDALHIEEHIGFIEKEQNGNVIRHIKPCTNFDRDKHQNGSANDHHQRLYQDLSGNGNPGQCQDIEHISFSPHAYIQADKSNEKQQLSSNYENEKSNEKNAARRHIEQTKECKQEPSMRPTNRNYRNLSLSCSPVPAIYDINIFPKDLSQESADSGISNDHNSQQSDIPMSESMASGAYMTMNATTEYSDGMRDTINSDLEIYPFTMIKLGDHSDQEKLPSITSPKYIGRNDLNSIDSGVSV